MMRSKHHLPMQIRLIAIGFRYVKNLPDSLVLVVSKQQDPTRAGIVAENHLQDQAGVVAVSDHLVLLKGRVYECSKSTFKVLTIQRRHQVARNARSEEHTSELQSLMRISYAVFCLKKKKQDKQ